MRALAICMLAVPCVAQPLVNLARLPIASVFDGSGRTNDTYYGVRNAFDAGTNIVQGLRYTTWNGGQGAFAIVRFSRPVTVTGISIDPSGELPAPEWIQVQLRGTGLTLSPVMERRSPRTIHAPARPVTGVREVMVTFAGSGGAVEEIEIYGPAPAGVSLTAVTPPIDAELVRLASADRSGQEQARTRLVGALAQLEIERMRAAKEAADRGTTAEAKARAWLDLNRAADRLIEWLDQDEALKPLADQASALGVSIDWCDPGAHWFARGEGYAEYLRLLPSGPEADDAFWQVRWRACGDFEATREEYEELVEWYSEFLRRFPTSAAHAPEARQRLFDAQEELKKLPRN